MYYPGQKIETTARTGVQACALSSMHAPVVWHARLSQFFWPAWVVQIGEGERVQVKVFNIQDQPFRQRLFSHTGGSVKCCFHRGPVEPTLL